jgi:YD repeat-containing protein
MFQKDYLMRAKRTLLTSLAIFVSFLSFFCVNAWPFIMKEEVPNVVGTTQANATSTLTALHLSVSTASAQSSTVAAGVVISQSPIAGTFVTLGTSINLVISLGPPSEAVPNVVGATQANAASTLTTAGLSVGIVTTQNSSAIAAGNVISESPAAGTSVALGASVNLVVSLGPPPTQYTYDNLKRLISVQYGDGTIIQYIYDDAGNRIATNIIPSVTGVTGSSGNNSPDNTSTTIISSSNPSTLDQWITFTATVTDSTNGTVTPAGTVQFQVDSSPVGPPVSLSNGTATSSLVADLSVGDHDVTAVFSSTGNFASSIAYLQQTMNQSSNATAGLSLTVVNFSYNRRTKLFSGDLIVTNSGQTTVSGPFVIWLQDLPAGVTLVNGNVLLNGYPYIEPPTPTSIGPGQSFTVQLQFSNSGDSPIYCTPVIFDSGSSGN